MGEKATLEQVEIEVRVGKASLPGHLAIPEDARAIVVFAQCGGGDRANSRSRFVEETLHDTTMATLTFDLLTEQEQAIDQYTRHLRFDIDRLAQRLTTVVDWARQQGRTAGLRIGLCGVGTGAAAAIVAASERPEAVAAVVSCAGRPDLAADSLARVRAPVLLLVGGRDRLLLELNRAASQRLQAVHRLEAVPGASQLLNEPGAIEQAAGHARQWFVRYLT